MRYAPDEHPVQAMYLRCHDKVVWFALQKPKDWPAGELTYPPAIAWYGSDQMWIANEGEPLPLRFFDYFSRTPCARELGRAIHLRDHLVLFVGIAAGSGEAAIRIK